MSLTTSWRSWTFRPGLVSRYASHRQADGGCGLAEHAVLCSGGTDGDDPALAGLGAGRLRVSIMASPVTNSTGASSPRANSQPLGACTAVTPLVRRKAMTARAGTPTAEPEVPSKPGPS